MRAQPGGVLSIKTAASGYPIDNDDARLQCRVVGSAHDDLFAMLIPAACEWVEAYTGRALLERVYTLAFDRFPCAGEYIELPRAPLASASITFKYRDAAGDLQTLASTVYRVERGTGERPQPARVLLAVDQAWPTATDGLSDTVLIEFPAGYANAAAVPQGLKNAALQRLQSRFEGDPKVSPYLEDQARRDAAPFRVWNI